MNKFITILLLFSITTSLTALNELKIYRTKVTKGDVAGVITLGSLLTTLGLVGTGAIFINADELPACIIGTGAGTFITIFGVTFSIAQLKSFAKWHKKKDKPILIFDEEGFTYEKWMGLFPERKDIRYLWKDVIATWQHTTVNQYGSEIEKSWCYHIKGEKEVVKINVHELDIPTEIYAQVEAVRRGYVKALTAS